MIHTSQFRDKVVDEGGHLRLGGFCGGHDIRMGKRTAGYSSGEIGDERYAGRLQPQAHANTASGTVDIPTTSAPCALYACISAGVS